MDSYSCHLRNSSAPLGLCDLMALTHLSTSRVPEIRGPNLSPTIIGALIQGSRAFLEIPVYVIHSQDHIGIVIASSLTAAADDDYDHVATDALHCYCR